MATARQIGSRRPARKSAGTTRLLAAAGVIALLGGVLAIVASAREGDKATPVVAKTTVAAPKPRPVVRKPTRVKVAVAGVGAYDPEGDRSENGPQAGMATDGIATTAWKSEHYRSTFSKSGVGLVVDAGKPVKASKLVVTTETPGYVAQVQAGNSATGPFASVSASKTTAARTVFALRPRQARYLMVWITAMPAGGLAAVNEVRVTARR